MKKRIIEIIIQIIPVMIGVYLGFVLTNWGEHQKKKNQSLILEKNIINEININKNKLISVVEYHKILRDSSGVYLKEFPMKKLSRPPVFFKGIQTPTLIKSAYSTGNQTGIIANFKISKIQSLNQLYTAQKEYNEFNNIVLERIMNLDFDGKEKSIRKFLQIISISMTDITLKENELIKAYNAELIEMK